MSRVSPLALFSVALVLFSAHVGAQPFAPSPLLLDTVVAVIEGEADPAPRFVLRSDFVLALRVELVTRGAPDALHVSVDPVYVSTPVLETLCADPEAFGSERAQLVARLGGASGVHELLAATGASRSELDALVRRRSVARRFLVQRQPRLIVPSTRELRVRWEEERHRAPNDTPETFAAARQPLAERMIAEAYPRALRQYLRALGGRVRVRYTNPESSP